LWWESTAGTEKPGTAESGDVSSEFENDALFRRLLKNTIRCSQHRETLFAGPEDEIKGYEVRKGAVHFPLSKLAPVKAHRPEPADVAC
jgi:hypothetical protein